MGDGAHMAYGSDGLRNGAAVSDTAGAVAEESALALQGVPSPAASAFGRVIGADVLAAAMTRARDAHMRTGFDAHARHVDLAGRSVQAAGDGDGLTTSTTAVARSAAPGAITAGMG